MIRTDKLTYYYLFIQRALRTCLEFPGGFWFTNPEELGNQCHPDQEEKASKGDEQLGKWGMHVDEIL